jgi:magnesium transporter
MKKNKANYAKKAGLPPESLVYTGNRQPSPAVMEVLVYDEDTCEKSQTGDIHQLKKLIDRNKVNLIIINNLTDVTLIESLGKLFGIQPMILEDVLNISHLPKMEESGEQLLFTLKFLDYPVEDNLMQQHISLILGEYYILVLKDFENRIFEDIKNRIVNGKSRARQKKSDYLFYLLIDTLIDSYYGIVDEINNNIDKMEDKLIESPGQDKILEIYLLRKPVSELRGVIYPVREALLNIVQGDSSLLEDATIVYMQDVKDHINQIIHMYEKGQDTLSALIELNSSNINNRLNRSMNLLTIMTTLFIPLTLIAGIYGMNFKFMPELGMRAGYPFALLLMGVTAAIMFYIMKRKKLL